MAKKFQLEARDSQFRWVENDKPFGTLQFTDIAGDDYYAGFNVYRIAFIGHGSAVAYYLTAVAPREIDDQSDAIALHKSMAIFGKVDPWSKEVRGDGFINHEEHLVGQWSTKVAKYSSDYMRREAFVVQNKAAFARAHKLGATFVADGVYSVKKLGDVYQIFTDSNVFYYAAFVVSAMGLGPHRGLQSGKGAPKLPDNLTPYDVRLAQRRLAASVMDLDRFMREYDERDGIDEKPSKRVVAHPAQLVILVHGANAGIDAVQRAWQLGHQVKWLCPGEPAFLKGNRLPIRDKQVVDVTRHMLVRDSEVVVSPIEDGRVHVQWTDDTGSREADVDIYVIAVGQDPYAPGAVGDVLFKCGNIKETDLSMIWDFDQVFGLPFQTILGYQIPGRRKGFGLQIIGASCEVLTRTLGEHFKAAALIDDFKRQLTPVGVEPTIEHCNKQIDDSESLNTKWGSEKGRQEYYEQKLQNWKRANAQRERFELLAEAYLDGLKGSRSILMDLLSHQMDPGKVPSTLSTILDDFKRDVFMIGQLATPRRPGTSAGASAILPSQLSAVRAVVAALTSFIPEYILRGDSNFNTDDRNMLAVYIAQNFQGFAPIDANARVSATMSLRRTDSSPLGFHNDELRNTIQTRWKRESKG